MQNHAPLPESNLDAAPGLASVAASITAPVLKPKGFWIRLLAFALDWAILIAAAMVLGLTHGLLFRTLSESTITLYEVLLYLSHPIFVCTLGASPGKALLGMKVVHAESGKKLSFWRALLRDLGYIPGAVVLGMGFLWIAGDPKKQGWHDKLANTLVVARD